MEHPHKFLAINPLKKNSRGRAARCAALPRDGYGENMIALHEGEDEALCGHYSQEHGERVNGGVGNGG